MNKHKSILILGASSNPARTSNIATRYLHNKGYNLVAIANKKGQINDLLLHDDSELCKIMHSETVTLFLNPERQKKYYEYILSLNPKRIIFNPGTENPELAFLAEENNIQVITGCTIAMITAGII